MSDDSVIFTQRDYDHYLSECESVAPDLARVVVEVLKPGSVIDVGCGLGIYLREFAALGLEVRGYEISPYALEHSLAPPGAVRRHDLRRALFEHRRYDLCVCTDVGEHLEEPFADHLVSLVTRLSDAIYWGAGEPGTGDKTHHVNEQPPEYWMGKFEARGWRYDDDATQEIKARIKEACPFVYRNIHVWADAMIYFRCEAD